MAVRFYRGYDRLRQANKASIMALQLSMMWRVEAWPAVGIVAMGGQFLEVMTGREGRAVRSKHDRAHALFGRNVGRALGEAPRSFSPTGCCVLAGR